MEFPKAWSVIMQVPMLQDSTPSSGQQRQWLMLEAGKLGWVFRLTKPTHKLL